MPRAAIAAFVAVQFLAGIALAQSAPEPEVSAPGEYGRASGAAIDLLAKRPSRLSGSFGIRMSTSDSVMGTSRGLSSTVGGTAVQDRVWFFASAAQSTPTVASRFAADLPQMNATRALSANAIAQLGDRNNLSATAIATHGTGAFAPVPASLLSLHFTSALSSNMFFSANVSRSSQSRIPADLLAPR